MCGFNELERDERIARAHEILNSTELKQAICHRILGTTHKDVVKAMEAIIKEKQLTPAQEDELELREIMPEKFEPEFRPEVTFKVNKKAGDPVKDAGYREYTREEVAALLAASKAPTESPPVIEPTVYPTMTREQCEALMADHFAYIENEKKKREERDEWDSQKTTGLGPKIKQPTKRGTSTKT